MFVTLLLGSLGLEDLHDSRNSNIALRGCH
jgi:hypothetical protein